MKKFCLLLGVLFFLTGCTNNKAIDPVVSYLEKFRNHDKEVMSALDELLRQEDLLEEQEDIYKLIMKRQYTDLEYSIKEEIYNGNKATILVDIMVYDYENSKQKARLERDEHLKDYTLSSGVVDKDKFMNLQLKYMKEEKKRVKYTLLLSVKWEQEEWVLEPPDYKVIEKIHGIYSYLEED